MLEQNGRENSKDNLEKIYDLADVYHSDNIERVSEDFIEQCGITEGNFDNVGNCVYSIPTHWDIEKFYKRLIKQVAEKEKIDDYNSSVYYENPSYILECFLENKII